MTELETLEEWLKRKCPAIVESAIAHNELTIVVDHEQMPAVALSLRDEFHFEQLIDLAGVDYSEYGEAQWKTEHATDSSFSRGVSPLVPNKADAKRYAVVYHLLSVKNNQRLRVKAYLDHEVPRVASVAGIWPVADWYEREAFDLFGILFEGHPDLRRILTDYGFIGHPFRKDFPVSGHVEMRYDEKQQRVVYEPVEIEPRVLVPRVIRHDNRYQGGAHG